MASKTSRPASKPRSTTPRASSAGGRKPAGGGSRASAPGPRGPGLLNRAGAGLSGWLATDEGLMFALGLGAVTGALMLWFELGGPLAAAASYTAGAAVGVGRYALPVCLVVVAVRLPRRGRPAFRRLVTGLTMSTIAFAGLSHLARLGSLDVDVDAWRRAGGAVGAYTGDPPRSLMGGPFAAVVLLTLLVAGIFVAFRLSG